MGTLYAQLLALQESGSGNCPLKAASAALAGRLASKTSWLVADLYTFELKHGTTLRLTSLDSDVIFGGQRFESSIAVLRRGSLKWARGLEASTLDITLAGTGVRADLLNMTLNQSVNFGLWDGAKVRLERVWDPVRQRDGSLSADALGEGSIILFVGEVGEVPKGSRVDVEMTVYSILEKLNTQLPRHTYQPQCDWELYDAGCQVSKAAFQVGPLAVQAGANSKRKLIVPAFNLPPGIPGGGAPAPPAWLDQGSLTFTTGRNAGLRRTILQHLVAGATYQSVVIADSPIAYYRLNEAGGAGALVDSSGHGYNGTPHGLTLGVADGALPLGLQGSTVADFDGINDWASLPVPKPSTLAGYMAGVTWEFWIKPNISLFEGVFDSGPGVSRTMRNNGRGQGGFEWHREKETLHAGYTGAVGVWQYVAVVYRGLEFIDVYAAAINVSNASIAAGGQIGWSTPVMGRVQVSGGPVYFGGRLAHFAIYGYPLSPGQLYNHYTYATVAPPAVSSVTLLQELAYEALPGEQFTALPGCDHSLRACIFKFDNLEHNGSQPFVPGDEQGL